MIFGLFEIVFLAIGVECEVVVGVYERRPYIGKDDGVFNRVCRSMETDLKQEFKYKEFDEEVDAIGCVLKKDCDFTFVGLRHNLTLSYPVVSESLIIVNEDLRMGYLKDLFWQYIVLMLTIWLPVLIIFSHFNYFFEVFGKKYDSSIFLAIWLNFSIHELKKPCSKVWVFVTWTALCFVFLVILADLASIIASANSYDSVSLGLTDYSDSCSSFDSVFTGKISTAESCVEDLKNSKVSFAIIGKLELKNFEQSEIAQFIIRDSLAAHQLFHLAFIPGTNTELYDKVLKSYWEKGVISSIYSQYYKNDYKSVSRYSLFFKDFYIVFVGCSFLTIFLTVVLICKCFCKSAPITKKLNDCEPSPSSRSLLERVPSQTLSLEQSVFRAGPGRPEEWINKAVDIQDDNAHKFKNIQDYENELSAVESAHPSNMTDRSILSLMKSASK